MLSRTDSLSLKERLRPSRFFKGESATVDPVYLSHRRIFILPTLQGMVFAITLLLMLVVSLNYNLNLGFALTFLLASVAILSIFHTFKNLSAIKVDISQVTPVFSGKAVEVKLNLSQSGSARKGLSVFHGKKNVVKFDLDKQSDIVSFTLPASSRGRYKIGTVTISSNFPFGLFRAWSPINCGHNYLVYPEPSRLFIPLTTCLNSFHDSAEVNGRREESFAGLEEYKPGDPIKKIHWKSLAKGNELLVKQFEGEGGEEISINWNRVPGPGTEERLSQLCRQVVEAEKGSVRYGLELPSGKISPSSGAGHYQKVLEKLAIYPQ